MGELQSAGNMAVGLVPSQSPSLPNSQPLNQTIVASEPAMLGPQNKQFPSPNAIDRLSNYEYFNNLMLGQHFEAFAVKVNSADYTKDYAKLRYIAVNFAGLISKINADMLFSEPISIRAAEGADESTQEWIDGLVFDNKLNEQFYESAFSNSALGDAVFKLRVGPRNANDDESTVIIEDMTPSIFFPQVDSFNVRNTPGKIELAWTLKYGDKEYLRKEIHTIGLIENQLFEMAGTIVMQQVPFSTIGLPNIPPQELTDIDRYMIVHIPNWKTGNRFFGISDYLDLDKLFYAINNRISKIDNILDKHSDPILVVPPGILDEKGKVKKEKLHLLELPEGSPDSGKPEYIIWNANLEAAMVEIDKLMDFFMMTAEITPDILGMGQGMNDSGRALKFKLMRTIAKSLRKKLYYDRGIKELIYTAQLLAKEHDLVVGPEKLKFKGEPKIPNIIWQDGLPIDDYEEVQIEAQKIEAGLQTKKDAIMNLDNLDEDAAEEKLKEIQDENPLPELGMNMTPADFTKQNNTMQTTQVKAPQNPMPKITVPASASKNLPKIQVTPK